MELALWLRNPDAVLEFFLLHACFPGGASGKKKKKKKKTHLPMQVM